MSADRPWMTALEQQFASLRYSASAVENPNLHTIHAFYRLSAQALGQAETYAWSRETTTAVVMAARTVPTNTELGHSSADFHTAWWWLDEHLKVFVTGLDGESVQVRALLLATGVENQTQRRGMFITTFGYPFSDNHRACIPFTRVFWAFGESITSVTQLQADDIRGREFAPDIDMDATKATLIDSAQRIAPFVIAALSWLHQRIVTVTAGQVERHRRKQLVREYGAVVSDVKVVQLRRSETESRPTSAEAESVEWSCRWIVNGHWRNQPYADGPKLIYIMPFVKGPADKPLRVPSHTVYSVSR